MRTYGSREARLVSRDLCHKKHKGMDSMSTASQNRSYIVKSIGLCVANPTGAKKKPCVMIAYAIGNTENDIRMLSVPLPKKTLYTREELLACIAKAENARTVQYLDFDGEDKDIYVCRPEQGEVLEIVPRDDFMNRFEAGFAEIQSDFLKFGVEMNSFKIGRKIEARIFDTETPEYERDSYEYALINAYNACLLGRVFSESEFQLETVDHQRVKREVKQMAAKGVDEVTLYVKPEKQEGQDVVLSYLTEPINVIDGDDKSLKIYRISYWKHIKDYSITRYVSNGEEI